MPLLRAATSSGTMSVIVMPGATELMRTPCAASSLTNPFCTEFSAPLDTPYSSGEPIIALPLDTETMLPPLPPRAVDMSATASLMQPIADTTFVSISVRSSAAQSSTALSPVSEPRGPMIAALFTSAATGPRRRRVSANSRLTSASTAMSACTATATPPSFSMSATTAAAMSAFER